MRRADSKTAIRKRRRKGDGGLYEESGQWCAEWHDSENRRHRAYGATPELALARKAKRIQVAFIQPPKPKQRGSIGTASNPTVQQAMETWLLNNERIGEVSRGKYRRNLERYVIPYIGNRAVKRLMPDDMEMIKTKWKQQHVGQSAMWHVWKTLNTMMNAMVKKGTIKSNPMIQVDSPKRTNRRAEHIEAYISDHTQTALGIIAWTAKEDTPCHRYHALVMAMALGLRRAEALGLTQAALLPASETLEIRTRLKQKVGGGYYLQPATKNGHYRTIRLPHMHYMALANAKHENAITLPIQDEDGTRIGEGKILLTREDGKNYAYNDWGEIWREIQTAYKKHIWGEDAKLEVDDYIIPHEMRHITSSILGEQGESMKTVQSILGHMTPEMTEHYTHLLEGGRIETAERWNTNLESMAEFISSTMEEVAKASTEAESDSDEKNATSRIPTRKQGKQAKQDE